jgi:hypothetical protein
MVVGGVVDGRVQAGSNLARKTAQPCLPYSFRLLLLKLVQEIASLVLHLKIRATPMQQNCGGYGKHTVVPSDAFSSH